MSYKIAILKGDGIGPEVVTEGIKVLNKIKEKFNIDIEYKEGLIGGIAIDTTGNPLPNETIDLCKNSDAVLLGAVGGPKWDNQPRETRPETGLLKIRKELGLFANIRPAKLIHSLKSACPLKEEIADKGIDITVVRELTGGIYFGEKGTSVVDGIEEAFDTDKYNEIEVRRIAKVAFEMAKQKNGHVTSIDKSNVMETSKLWKKIVIEVSKDYPSVPLSHMLVDNAAMQLVKNPSQFDIVLTNNIFGDILSDEAAMITGSIGILPSSSMATDGYGLYEPIHGSAPDIAGKNIANPIATILSIAMMLRNTFGEDKAASAIEDAVNSTLSQGYKTSDLDPLDFISCSEMGDKIAQNIV